MIRFVATLKPAGFMENAEEPGSAWLAANPQARRPRDLWSPFKADLAQGFHNLCAYSCLYEPVGTVDHFVSYWEDKTRAYDWANYRYASQWINASKGKVPSKDILDPFEVGEGWFEIQLPSLQLLVSGKTPDQYRSRAEFVLERLRLRDDERVLRQRREWYRMYRERELTLEGLRRKAPLIAEAVERDGALEP